MIGLLRSTGAYRELKKDASEGKLFHADLVLFPDEKYLRPLLRECAKAMFGASDGERTAHLIDEESFSDCLFLPAAGEKLTVELAARILEESALRPVEGEKKLFVIDRFHTASALVQNKLLKALEEPPAGVYFLLGATSEHAVLPTVLSRVKKLVCPPFPEGEVAAALVRGGADSEQANRAAAASGGLYSSAEALLYGGGEEFEAAEALLLEENFAAVCRRIDDKKDKRAFFAAVKLLLRDALFWATGRKKWMASSSEGVARIANEYPAPALLKGIELAGEAEKEIQFNANLAQAALTFAVGIRKEKEIWQRLS